MSSIGPPSEAAPLSAREQDALVRLATAEFRADPRFANDLAAGRVTDREGRAARRVAVLGVLLVVVALVGLVASGVIVPAVVLAVTVLVAVALVGWARRQESRR